jgi:5'-deoxynucleotidase YfbR-like HD superfamily hydrolase
MPILYKKPFSRTEFQQTIDDIVVPAGLEEYMTLGARVHRYKFQSQNFDHIFFDTVDDHTKRMVLYAQSLPLSDVNKSAVIRTLWIHDIPEIIDSQTTLADMTSTDKIRYPDLAKAVKEREQKIVDNIFTDRDKALYAAFGPAKEMLFSGKIDYDVTTPNGLIARILDTFIDGTNSFHAFVTDYLQNETYDVSLSLPDRDSFAYCLQKAIDVRHHVKAIDRSEYREAQNIILAILDRDFFSFVEKLWTPLALSRLPNYALAEHNKYMEQIRQ